MRGRSRSGTAPPASPGRSRTTNSLVGTNRSDHVGNSGVTALTNGNYVVTQPVLGQRADRPMWGRSRSGDGTTGITGPVTTTNSLVGTTANDKVGYGG